MKCNRWHLTIVFLLSGLTVFAQNPTTTINCIQNDLVNNNIAIHWDSASTTGMCGPFVEYRLYGAPIGSPASLVTTISVQSDTDFTHIGALAIDNNWYYYISVVRNCPLNNESVFSDTVFNSPPDIPYINYISNENGYAVLNWQPSIDPKTCFYVIYYSTPSGIIRWDTVWGWLNTTYVANPGRFDANQQPISLTVEANDCCGNNNGPNRDPDASMYLSYSVDRCNASVDLLWTAYYGWFDSLFNYTVYVSVNGGAFQNTAAIDSSLNGYSYTGFNDNDSLCFYVVANNSVTGDTSLSNVVCLTPSVVQGIAQFYVTNVTVNDFDDIEITWLIDSLSELLSYGIENHTEGNSYLPLKNFPVPVPLSFYDTVIDSVSDPNINYYYTRLEAMDSCGNPSKSTEGRSIYLATELSNFYQAHLQWNAFQLEHAVVTSYNIYRDIGTGYALIATVPASQTDYTDDLSSFYNDKGIFCYRVEADFDLNLPGGIFMQSISYSNKSCVDHVPVVYIPNAIRIGGTNNTFAPVIFFGDLSNYEMQIYNRWGQLLFETHDINTAWDGTHHSKHVPEGGYVYLIRYRSVDGVDIEKKGIVMVVE